ncbi:MAG: M20/M25/M40 family metallo-hydrolase [Deltaproteobacteria bacterium]|nr:M20/M25/M40 family metallo-hydrolase [Deltaproteobacteria bacterium]
MTRTLLPLCLAALFAGCGDDDDSAPDGDADSDADADAGGDADTDADADADADADGDADGDADLPDPIELAEQVSEDEILATISDLEAFETRETFTSGDDDARDYLVGRLEAYGLPVEEDSFLVTGEEAANVIARKEGSVEPGAIWIFSAHYDSTSAIPRTSAPGADDNASGVAAVLEAARILAPVRTHDSLWFVATAAEEQGSLGSQHMAGWLVEEEVDVRGVIAPDMIAYWPLGDDDSFDILGDEDSEWLVEEMADMADALGVAYKTWIDHGYCYGDDHTRFQEAGFAAITPMDCVEAHNGVGAPETTPHYHQTTDTVDTLYLPFTTRVVQVIVAALASR